MTDKKKEPKPRASRLGRMLLMQMPEGFFARLQPLLDETGLKKGVYCRAILIQHVKEMEKGNRKHAVVSIT